MLDTAHRGGATVLPEVSRVSIAHHPLADDGGHEQQHQHGHVEDDDTQQQEQHSGGGFCSAEFPSGGPKDSCPRSSEILRAASGTHSVRALSG